MPLIMPPNPPQPGVPVMHHVPYSLGTRRSFFWLTVGVLLFIFTFLIRSILLPFLLGIFIAYFLHPTADRLEKKWKLSRGSTTGIMIGGFFLTFILAMVLVVPLIANEISALITGFPGYVSKFQQQYGKDLTKWMGKLSSDQLDNVKDAMGNISGEALKMAGAFLVGFLHSGMALLNLLSLVLITPIVAFYMLRDWNIVTYRMNSMIPRPYAHTVGEQFAIIDRTLAGFIRGQINVCLLLGSYYAVTLELAGLNFGILIGLGTGILVIFPYIGLALGTTVGLGVAFFQFENYSHIAVIAAIFVIGQITEAYILTPRLVGAKVGLHPVWIIFGMLAGAALFGFVGILLALPITAVIGVLIRFMLNKYLLSSYYQGEIRSETI